MLKVFNVYDSKAEAYNNPFFLRSSAEAIRSFSEATNDQNTNLSKFPEDFTLFKIGTYDELTGIITPYKTHISLGRAIEFKKQPLPINHNLPPV